mmetsp:Transcript_15466/g.58821  ORF Transcript_15466/g.58821 Transcript_15466/m.58821 type:complete len:265 (-) Transcript_15466:1121-1915(-)
MSSSIDFDFEVDAGVCESKVQSKDHSFEIPYEIREGSQKVPRRPVALVCPVSEIVRWGFHDCGIFVVIIMELVVSHLLNGHAHDDFERSFIIIQLISALVMSETNEVREGIICVPVLLEPFGATWAALSQFEAIQAHLHNSLDCRGHRALSKPQDGYMSDAISASSLSKACNDISVGNSNLPFPTAFIIKFQDVETTIVRASISPSNPYTAFHVFPHCFKFTRVSESAVATNKCHLHQGVGFYHSRIVTNMAMFEQIHESHDAF